MQGLPIQQLQKSAQGSAKGLTVDSAKTSQSKNVVQGDNTTGDFATLFAGMTGKAEAKTSQVESQSGDILKNLLAEKNGAKVEEGKETNAKGEVKQAPHLDAAVAIDPKIIAGQSAEIKNSSKSNLTTKEESKGELKFEQKIAKTSTNLDQLLNNLKGTQDIESVESIEEDNGIPAFRQGKGEQIKGESKNESPLDFLMKGAKAKGVTEANPVETKSLESVPVQKKVVTGEDFLKNMQATEKKPALALIDGQKENSVLSKMMNSSAKSYGQGMNLMNDSLIRNTKDLANKDIKKGKQNLLGVDELHTKDTKVGAELSSLRQEAIPTLQNTKDNHGQSQLSANTNQKVLDLSHLNTSNTTEIIKKISDYVEQSNVANKQSLDLTVKHDSLGEFKIQVSKLPESMNNGLNQIDMQITTSSKEGHDFFLKHEVNLMKNLNQAGINLSDLRIVSSSSESSAFGQTDSRQSSSFSQNPDGSKQFASFESSQFSSDNGSQRRKELWEEYQQRYGA